jgi:RimJ/RimL family protein N-acetyltransferase
MIITTESLILKRTGHDDPELSTLIEDTETASSLSETRIFPEMPRSVVFRIEKDNRLIGEAGYKNIKWINRKAELNIVIKKDFRNKGYGREVLTEMINYGFKILNFHRLEAEVYEYNKASIMLVENLGFAVEGKLREAKYNNGKYYNIIRYGLLKNEWQKIKE